MNYLNAFRKNRLQWLTLAALVILFLLAIQGMETKDWVITLLRSLAVGSVTFLVAAGFSLIFGLMDVLNLAHGTLFMIGAYVGWTVYVRPDTFVDLLTPALLIVAGVILLPLYKQVTNKWQLKPNLAKTWPWVALAIGLIALWLGLNNYPITSWDPGVYEVSPITFSYNASQGTLVLLDPVGFEGLSPVLVIGSLVLGSVLLGFSLAGFSTRFGTIQPTTPKKQTRYIVTAIGVTLLAFVFFYANDALTAFLITINSTWLFLLAILIAFGAGGLLGAMMESTMIRPLYERPIYQLMLTLGLSAIGIEFVREVWGRPEFTMPRPALFNGGGEACPATSLADWLQYQCSIIKVFDARIRVYNEIFIPLVGLVVLVAVWLLLKRTRLGMIIRAGVQDSQMVEALGINVRRVFTMVFALGVGLAALGGVIAGPSFGLSNGMGESLLLNALIALAIGGLTSYPGAAAGSLIVGLLQQFIIKYGSIGINLPFLKEPFKPTPPLVPASTVLLMVIILLVLPQGLFGRKE